MSPGSRGQDIRMPRVNKIKPVGCSKRFRILRGKRRAVLYGPEWVGTRKKRGRPDEPSEWSPGKGEVALRVDHIELERLIAELQDVLAKDVVKV